MECVLYKFPIFNFSRAGGGAQNVRWISAIGGGTFGMHGSESRGQASVLVFLRFNRPSFPERRAGDGVFDISLPSAIDLLACVPAGREEERDKLVTFLRFRHLSFPKRGVGGRVFCGSLQSAAALLVCMPAGREGKRAERF